MTETTTLFSTKEIYWYHEGTNYTQPLQQRDSLMVVRVHTSEKEEKAKMEKFSL
jgi:hypothetical protein